MQLKRLKKLQIIKKIKYLDITLKIHIFRDFDADLLMQENVIFLRGA